MREQDVVVVMPLDAVDVVGVADVVAAVDVVHVAPVVDVGVVGAAVDRHHCFLEINSMFQDFDNITNSVVFLIRIKELL